MIAHRRQRGLTLLETALSLAVLALVTASFVQMSEQNAAHVRARASGDRMAQVVEAAKSYLRVNYAALVAQTSSGTVVTVPVGRTSGGGAVPSGPGGLPSLQGGGYLPDSYVDMNPYGQSHTMMVRQPAPGRLEVLVASTGGRAMRDGDLGEAASKVGSEGGFMMTNPVGSAAAGDIVGVYGGWRSSTATWNAVPAAGHLMASIALQNDQVLADYLYRYNTGNPDANRMHTAIDMNGNDINNANVINTVILNATQDVNANNDVNAAHNLTAGNDVNAVRNLSSGNDATIARDLAVGRDGSVTRNLAVGQDASVTRNLTVGQDGSVTRNLTVGQDGSVTRDLTIGRDATATGNVTGADVFTSVKGRTLAQAVQDATIMDPVAAPPAPAASQIAKPTCPTGQTAEVFVSPVVLPASGRPVYAFKAYAVDAGSYWYPGLRLISEDAAGTSYVTYDVAGPYAKVLVFTKCT